ncbi:MAG: TetR/AcrR family transcriptional regulator, partial [Parvibaculaceae bacterium]|nr:TetR/AcrR family transcriptional regulator [Parvibaculaceae bacterium]
MRRQLLDAALQEFSRDGYDRVSLDQVAAAAGFSKGAIYSNFANKEDLFLTLMDQQVRDLIQAAATKNITLAPSIEGQGRIDEGGRRMIQVVAADEDFQLLYLEYVTRSAREPSARQALADRRRSVRALVADAACAVLGPEHPLWDRMTPALFATAMLALSNGIALERIATPDEVPDSALGDLVS